MGRFRDRKLAERLPHRLIEGALIASHALGADRVYFCVQADWQRARSVLSHALDEARAAGWVGRPLGRSAHAVEIHLHVVPGPLPSRGGDHLLPHLIECGRPEPRATECPSDPPTLFGASVLVHTAATLGYLPGIISRGADAFRQIGGERYPGTVAVSVSGHVSRPGLFEVEIGSGSFGDVIDDCAGGLVERDQGLAVFTGGAPASSSSDLWSMPIDPSAWEHPGGGALVGSFGTGALVLCEPTALPLDLASRWLEWAASLGCGQCPGCREGAAWLAHYLKRLRRGGAGAVDLDAFEQRLQHLEHSERDGLMICGHPTLAAQVTRGLLQIEPDALAQQAQVAASACDADHPLRTPDSIHLRF